MNSSSRWLPHLPKGELEDALSAQVLLSPLPFNTKECALKKCSNTYLIWPILPESVVSADSYRDPNPLHDLSHSAPCWSDGEEHKQQGDVLRVGKNEWMNEWSLLVILNEICYSSRSNWKRWISMWPGFRTCWEVNRPKWVAVWIGLFLHGPCVKGIVQGSRWALDRLKFNPWPGLNPQRPFSVCEDGRRNWADEWISNFGWAIPLKSVPAVVSALACSCEATSKKQNWSVESNKSTGWRRDSWTDPERKDPVRLTLAECFHPYQIFAETAQQFAAIEVLNFPPGGRARQPIKTFRSTVKYAGFFNRLLLFAAFSLFSGPFSQLALLSLCRREEAALRLMLERREAELREAMKLRHSLTTLLHALRVNMEQVSKRAQRTLGPTVI